MAQTTTTLESVWAAKGNLPDNAIVATADGKYPALDGSLITNVGAGDLLAANNLSELTATASVARTNLELGATDTVEFGAFIPPAGTTAEIDAVTTATIGQVMVNSDTNNIVRFVTPSTYQTLTSGGKLYLNTPDIGSTDYATLPQSWTTGGIIADQPLATSAPIAIKRKGWSRVTISGILNDLLPPTTSGNITVNVSGSAVIKGFVSKTSQIRPTPPVTSMVSSPKSDRSSYVFPFSSPSMFGAMATANQLVYELGVDIYNPTDSEVLVTYTYDTPTPYFALNYVSSIRIEALD